MHARTVRAAGALLCLLLLLPGLAAGAVVPAAHAIAQCSWSYFGDARSVVHQGHVYTACVGTDGSSLIEDFDLATDRRRLSTVFEPLEVDDHNNPSLVVFRGELYAFSAPHSGYRYPRNRRSEMRYRVLRDGRWGAVQTVPLDAGCGLGYTYPNPVAGSDRLYLFMRGPCWSPYFTSTADGQHWAAPRTLVRSPSPGRQDGAGTHLVRPYAKYASAPDGSVLMTFSDGHPGSFKSSLYFARLAGHRIYGADGRLIGTLADLPLRFGDLDRVDAYSRASGRAWPMDVAVDRSGAPVAVYTALSGIRDTFRYARWDGRRWRTHAIAAAGRTLFTYHNSGATLDHGDPSRVVLSRTVGGQNEIELHETRDGGESWSSRPVTRGSRVFNIRPVIPRGLDERGRLLVVYVAGSARSFREYDTTVVMRSVRLEDEQRSGSDSLSVAASAIQHTWACSPPGSCSQGAGSRRPSDAGAWAWSIALASSLWTAT